jgi:hypothetical protein
VYSRRQAPLAVSLIVTPVSLPTIAEQAPAVIVTPLTEIVATVEVTWLVKPFNVFVTITRYCFPSSARDAVGVVKLGELVPTFVQLLPSVDDCHW